MTFTWCILRLIRQKTGLNVKSGEVIFNSNRFVKNHRQYATHRSGPSTCQLSWKRTFSTEVPGNPSPENQSHIKDRGVEKGAEKRRLKEAKKEARRQARLKGIEKNKNKEKSREKVIYTSQTAPGEKKDTSCALPDSYSPAYVEAAWYSWWEKEGYFKPSQDGEPFVMCLPPPNVTGNLHLGHALTNSIQDAIVRRQRMLGRSVLWNPGCDHAGIATQVVVEKQLWQEKKMTRHDVGRKRFIEEAWRWKDEKGGRIYEQMKKLGSSLDWSRAQFTLDPKLSQAVTEAFVRLHDRGLIYRSNRLVNWSCHLRSAISDIEVENISLEGRTKVTVPGYERKVEFGTLTSFAYPVLNSDEELVVATTRLETMLGDTGVAVHPDDPRYRHLHGRHVKHPFMDTSLLIVCDTFVDREFGTGAVKITPAHDYNDFDVGSRHGLESPTVIDDQGHMTSVPQQFQGLKRFDARRAVLKALEEKGLIRSIVDHPMVLPICSRSKDVVEPRLKEQWFVSCHQMAQEALKAVKEGDLVLIPQSYEKLWSDWLEKIHDWCISRQLWWGHRIPAYHAQAKNQSTQGPDWSDMWVSGRSYEEALEKACQKLGVDQSQITLKQDEDVLDTWFSSALFPFSIFGWPDQTEDLERFFPTSLLETGNDIMFFWVARMVMLGQTLTGKLPFSQVLLHGILRDSHGRKMSKSLGNVIDPMDVIQGISLEDLQAQLDKSNLDPIEVKKAKQGQQKDFPLGIPECGTDALRFTLCSYNYKAHVINMDVSHVKSNRHFCNKIWQAHKYSMSKIGQDYQPQRHLLMDSTKMRGVDRWILSRLAALLESCERHFDSYDLHLASQALYQFWYLEFCDIYLECTKPVFQSPCQGSQKDVTREVLYTCMDVGLRALSPFMPYLSEELYQRLPPRPGHTVPESICVAPYPQASQYDFYQPKIEEEFSRVQSIVKHLLSLRKDFNMTKDRAKVWIECLEEDVPILDQYSEATCVLSRSSSFHVTANVTAVLPPGCITTQLAGDDHCRIHMQIKDLVDAESEIQKMTSKLNKLQQEVEALGCVPPSSIDDPKAILRTEKMGELAGEVRRLQRTIALLRNLD